MKSRDRRLLAGQGLLSAPCCRSALTVSVRACPTLQAEVGPFLSNYDVVIQGEALHRSASGRDMQLMQPWRLAQLLSTRLTSTGSPSTTRLGIWRPGGMG